jgi:hypothetical protein
MNQSGSSIPSSILSGTPDAPSMFAAWPSNGFGDSCEALDSTPGVAVIEDGICIWTGDSVLTTIPPGWYEGDADALDALSDAPAEWTECCDEVRGETRPFCAHVSVTGFRSSGKIRDNLPTSPIAGHSYCTDHAVRSVLFATQASLLCGNLRNPSAGLFHVFASASSNLPMAM